MFSWFSKSASESMEMDFTMGCTVEGKELKCTVDDGYAPALDQGIFCTVNDQPPEDCEGYR